MYSAWKWNRFYFLIFFLHNKKWGSVYPAIFAGYINWQWVVYFPAIRISYYHMSVIECLYVNNTNCLALSNVSHHLCKVWWVAVDYLRVPAQVQQGDFQGKYQIVSITENWQSLFTVGFWNTRLCYIHNWFLVSNTTLYIHVNFRFLQCSKIFVKIPMS